MKILLISSPAVKIKYYISGVHSLPLLGLAYLALALEKNNFCVEFLDVPALKMDLKNFFFI